MLKQKTYHIKGIAPLLLANKELANPMNKNVQKISEIRKKRTKTDSDWALMKELTWNTALYINEKHEIIIPGENIYQMLLEAATRQRKGSTFKYSVFIDENPSLEYDGPKEISELFKDERFVFQVLVPNKKTRTTTLTWYPRFDNWELKFTATYDDEQVNAKDVDKAVKDAGCFKALGTWRPRHGRYVVMSNGKS